MRISDLLSADRIKLGFNAKNRTEVVEKLIDLQMKSGGIIDREIYKKAILEREEISTTAVGYGIAIPHAKSAAVKDACVSAVTVPNGVQYGNGESGNVKLIFMIAAPSGSDVHLDVLSRLMTVLMDEDLRRKLVAAKTPSVFLGAIDAMESKKFGTATEVDSNTEKAKYKILAVTACPTGIAHTYMAEEALKKAAKKLGVSIKVETNGSSGVKHRLTDDEIANCDGIIIAADKSVQTARFDGKPLISVPVSYGIKEPEELINRILDGKAKTFKSNSKERENVQTDGDGFGRRMYKHLMNGVSNMLPFTVAGGIFIAVAFLIDAAAGNASAGADFGTVNPIAAFFKIIGGYAFNFMIPILAAFIGKSIADRPGFLVGLVGGYLAVTGSSFADLNGGVPSGFLGALFAGFVGGFLMLAIKKICDYLPKSLEGIKPVLIYPLAGLGIIALVMCAVNPVMGAINTGITNVLNSMNDVSKILLGAVLGGMMAIDMGGPFNKAAYVFGTAAIASGGYDIMAAVMIGGMTPPIAIALATTLFKSKFTAEEIKNGPVNYIMGLSFITEGAIPYAAADPLRVIPSCVVGSAAAGALSMAFRCTLMAPHGGIFVFAVVGNRGFYLLSLIIGSLVSTLLLGILKKKPAMYSGAKGEIK